MSSDPSGGSDFTQLRPSIEALSIPGLTSVVLIGEGGFGQVYRAHQRNFSRDVAVKVSRAPLHEATPRLRFERECRAMGMLSAHPNIVTVYESGYTDADLPYLIMEFAAPGSLHGVLGRDGPIDPVEVLSLGIRLAGALETAHRAGVLHRDIKPDNVLISAYGEPKLADFGLARLRDAPTTQTQRLTASLQHVPPELLRHGKPTEAGDICSLGSTLFELVSGRPPYWRDGERSIEPLIRRTSNEPPPDLRHEGVPGPLAEVIARALDRDPAGRPNSARAFGEALQQAQRALGHRVTRLVVEDDVAPIADVPDEADRLDSSERIHVSPEGLGAGTGPVRSRRRVFVLVSVFIVVVASAVALLYRPGNDSPGTQSTDAGSATDTSAAQSTEVGSATDTSAAQPTAAPSTTLGGEAAALLDFGVARFDATDGFCQNEPPSAYEDREWQVTSPIEPAPAGGSVTVGLRNKFGDIDEQRLDIPVTALVLGPDDSVATASTELSGAEFSDLLYPDSFADGSTEQTGVYTVIWRDAENNHIVCWGFEVA